MANVILESARGLQPVCIEDELLRHRQIFLDDQVDGVSCGSLIKQLMVLENDDSSKRKGVRI